MNSLTLEAVLNWLLRTSLEGSVLILAVLGLRMLLGRRLGPRWRLGLWLLVGAKLLLPACVPAGFGLGELWSQGGGSRVVAQEVDVPSLADAPAISETGQLHQPSVQGSVETGPTWVCILLGVWLVGGSLVLAVAILRQRQFESEMDVRPLAQDAGLLEEVAEVARLAGVRRPLPVVLMTSGSTPAVSGCLRPRLLLPEDWRTSFNAASLRHVLLHEILHVRHRDLWWNWVALTVQAVHWFNPLVWLVAARFQADRELHCDAEALARLSPNERFQYGKTLLRIQQTFFPPPAVAGLAPCVRNHPTLRQRIAMIAKPNRHRPWLHAVFAVSFGTLACYAFTTARAAEEDTPAASKERPRTPSSLGEEAREVHATSNPAQRLMALAPQGITTVNLRTQRGGGVHIDGEAATINDVIAFREAVTQAPDFKGWQWQIPPPSPKADGSVSFRFSGTPQRDGDQLKTGVRDGDKPRTGPRDGERPRTGVRDGDRGKSAERDGDRPRTGPRETERPGARESEEANARGAGGSATTSIQVLPGGESVKIGNQELPMNRLRGFLSQYVPHHPDTRMEVVAEADTPYKVIMGVVDALRDNGVKDVSFRAQ